MKITMTMILSICFLVSKAQTDQKIEYSTVIYANVINNFLKECPSKFLADQSLLLEYSDFLDSENVLSFRKEIKLLSRKKIKCRLKKVNSVYVAMIKPIYYKNSFFNIDIIIYEVKYKNRNFDYRTDFGKRYQFKFDCDRNEMLFVQKIDLGI